MTVKLPQSIQAALNNFRREFADQIAEKVVEGIRSYEMKISYISPDAALARGAMEMAREMALHLAIETLEGIKNADAGWCFSADEGLKKIQALLDGAKAQIAAGIRRPG